ncbi:MAG: hypothetical protein NVS3B21_10610 [Acidimicrobiales bacterium]
MRFPTLAEVSWIDIVVGSAAGVVGGGAVGAWATLKATRQTLAEERERSQDERLLAARDEFMHVRGRAGKQLVTSVTLLRLSERPSPPFFHIDHDALDDLLTYHDVPLEVAFGLEKASAALRQYNAAADWGNDKHPMTGAIRPAEEAWYVARDCASVAWGSFGDWCVPRPRLFTLCSKTNRRAHS